MANPLHKPILGSFEDIGENVVSQLKQIPKDVGQAALESIGVNASGKKGNTSVTNPSPTVAQGEQSHWQQMDTIKNDQEKRVIARKALEELLQPVAKQKEPSIWEKIQQEEEQKKAMAVEQQKKSSPVQLPSSGARKVPGMKSAVKAKQQGSEIGKNARQD